MDRKMEYKLLVQETTGFMGTNFPKAAEALSSLVNEQIADGWEPCGGISCGDSHTRDLPYLMQAMVRRSVE